LGYFKIVKRESVQDGVERLVYKVGDVAVKYVQERERLLHEASAVLSVSEGELVRSVDRFFNEWKEQRKKLESFSEIIVKDEAKEIIRQNTAGPVMRIVDLDPQMLKKLGVLVAESETSAACIMNKQGNLVCAAGSKSGKSAKDLLQKIIKELGGSGGGSDLIAQGKVTKVGIIQL